MLTTVKAQMLNEPYIHNIGVKIMNASQQRIAITSSPNYYQKMQRSTTRKNQEEHGPEVK